MDPNRNNTPQPKGPRFSMNWLYIFIIASLAIFFFTGNSENSGGVGKTAGWDDFKKWVQKDCAADIEVNLADNTLKMFVKPEKIRDVFQQSAQQVGTKPHLEVTYPDVKTVEEFLNREKQAKHYTGTVSYINKKGSEFLNILINLSPLIFFIVLWILMSRRMGGG